MISTVTKLDYVEEGIEADVAQGPSNEYYNLTHFNDNIDAIMPQLSETKEENSEESVLSGSLNNLATKSKGMTLHEEDKLKDYAGQATEPLSDTSERKITITNPASGTTDHYVGVNN